MDGKKSGQWSNSTTLARALLHDRAERRKWMFRLTMVPLGMLAVGLWVIEGWIWQSPWHVLIWWGACAAATMAVLIFAVYDALAVIREERTKQRTDIDKR